MTTEGGKMHSELQQAPPREASAHLDSNQEARDSKKDGHQNWELGEVLVSAIKRHYLEHSSDLQKRPDGCEEKPTTNPVNERHHH